MKRLALLLVALACLGAKPHQPTGVSLDARDWKVRYSQGVSLHALSGISGWYFDFPAAPNHVNYVTTAYATPIAQGQTVTFTAQIVATSGSPDFEPVQFCDTPGAIVRAYFEQKFKQDIVYAPETYRWWSNPIAVRLAPGTATVSTQITPDQWSDTFGQFGTSQPAGFAAAIAHPQAVGLTFGSPCFFGHGDIAQDGTARFVLTSYTIQ